MFYPHPFGHPIQYPFPPYSTGHYPMPTSQQNQVQPIIIKDIEKEIPKESKDGSYRNCLVCGDSNIACGWFSIAKNSYFSWQIFILGKNKGLQICDTCKVSEVYKKIDNLLKNIKAFFQTCGGI
jgi:hypothetical protein